MLQPVSARPVIEEFVKGIGMADGGFEKFDKAVHEQTGFHLDEQSPIEHVKAITVPTLVAQVPDDTMSRPEDVQSIYDALTVDDKDLHWIRGTEQCVRGYNYFGEHPDIPTNWFDKHLK
ncbi:alpha/beta hydrolase family protein [Actinomadura rayongensis]|uniref:alpha/beta hydrolase family protein n=1 Tax=Actinomadura rayongensis TaxID=1429076 RepID=UPI001925517E|nr:hypothetical protein [Actinomadura rayongensis]